MPILMIVYLTHTIGINSIVKIDLLIVGLSCSVCKNFKLICLHSINVQWFWYFVIEFAWSCSSFNLWLGPEKSISDHM